MMSPYPSPETDQPRRAGGVSWVLVDLLLWIPAGILAIWARLDFASLVIPGPASWAVAIFLITTATHLLVGILLGVYPPRTRLDSLGRQSLGVVAFAALVAGVVGSVTATVIPPVAMPRSVPLFAAFFVILAAFGMRAGVLAWRTHRARNREPVIVIGGGSLGRRIIAELSDPASDYDMVVKAVVDDDIRLRGARIHGVKVRGGLDELEAVTAATGATTAVVAINGIGPTTKTKITRLAAELDLKLMTVPTLEEISKIGAIQLKELDLATLMGREQVVLDEASIAQLISGKRVLVTGAGGSIGSELARQINRYGPAELVLLDRDEGGLHHTQLSLSGQALLDSRNIVLADIRDAERTREIFLEHVPEVVLHAAALKHQPLLEMYPREAWLTNVLGTRNVLDAAAACGASVVVNISTDKAANPSCVLGDSKRIAERLTAAYGETHEGTWVSVRFGNVLGSRGSVIETFRGQIEAGGPVTITHPDITRYFMTIPEASELVLQAAVVGASGETLVLDMGEPKSILELARGLMRVAGRDDIDIVYTGLRPGEKLTEELIDDRERPVRADRHPMVTEVRVDPLEQVPDCGQDPYVTLRDLARNPAQQKASLHEAF